MKETQNPPAEDQFDYVFAGGSVLRIDENVLTASGLYEAEKDGEEQPCVRIRVNDGDREKFFTGDLLDLKGDFDVKIKYLELGKEAGASGRIYLQKVNP